MAYTRIESLQLQYTVEIRPVYQLLSGNLHKLASVAGVIRQAFNEQSPVGSLTSWALASEPMLLLLLRSLFAWHFLRGSARLPQGDCPRATVTGSTI